MDEKAELYAIVTYSKPNDEAIILDDDDEDDDVIVTGEARAPTPPSPIPLTPSKRRKKPPAAAKETPGTLPLLTPLFAIAQPLNDEESALDTTEHPCTYCTKIFYNKQSLQVHELEHFKRNILSQIKERKLKENKCDICRKRFPEKNTLDWHRAECIGRFMAKSEIELDIRQNGQTEYKTAKNLTNVIGL